MTKSSQSDAIRVTVRPAQPNDRGRVLSLFEQTRKRVINFGAEDWGTILASAAHTCVIAETGPLLWGVLVASKLDQPTAAFETEKTWASVRACALISGWQTQDGINALWHATEQLLRAQKVQHCMHIADENWLRASLETVGFHATDHLETRQRGVGIDRADDGAGPADLRPAKADDIFGLLNVDTAAFAMPWRATVTDLTSFLVTHARLTVATMNETLVGYAATDAHGETGFLTRLAVHPSAQGQGIGRQLLTDALRFCRHSGMRQVGLNTNEQSTAARRLYENLGFRLIGARVPVLSKQLRTHDAA